ncbi:tRNA lysidine(34) synthetase TilS [Aquipuribacter sp. MA13-6]|uniref:tRNA lysidine(34) synthetase TilS n=1 Tax=unclassified Aquipuribacter TaxID=2635084 RepID=UPI003EEC39C0
MDSTSPQEQVGAATRQVQLAVRAALGRAGGVAGGRVVVGVSGGPDSLALLAATVHVAVGSRLRVHAVTVDHGWRHDSPAVAARVARAALGLGAQDVSVVRVTPRRSSGGGWVGGPEDAARDVRLRALAGVAERDGAVAVLLGHTLDDQAEQVLLGLARGSGSRALAGIPTFRPPFVRPLLGLRRGVVATACPQLPALGLPWYDPGNHDRTLLRSRVRADLLPVLADVLGPGAVPSLARSADLLRRDADALDDWAGREVAELTGASPPAGAAVQEGPVDVLVDVPVDVPVAVPVGVPVPVPVAVPVAVPSRVPVDVPVAPLLRLPDAVRTRVLRRLATTAGAGPLSLRHTTALDGLVVAWRGQGQVRLPGGAAAARVTGPDGCGRLRIAVDRTPREDPHGRP